MAEQIGKRKFIILIIITLIAIIITAFLGSIQAGKLAYDWLGIKSPPTITSIFDLLNAISQSGDNIPKLNKLKIIGATIIGVLITISPLILLAIILFKLKSKEELYGSANFATDFDIKKAGLLPTKAQRQKLKYPSILIGKYKKKFLHFSGQQFLYLGAPTRSGKGVGIVIPNLLNYADSVVCVDIKFENFLFTAGFREKCGQKVFLFSPDGFAESEDIRKMEKLNRTITIHYTISAVI
ncbi:type IV secretory system conjugative DNA transfer family protein [Volucribacter amazonae]|uniref:type IV secretory system conjugative DNA transfer family protein n=1 Tax=Volucribacter amazonae TaxID=256731 RepID=UPI0024414E51|nr:type IV secretory system conjugative DNA transfer family protein [Volucribacter amazonae]